MFVIYGIKTDGFQINLVLDLEQQTNTFVEEPPKKIVFSMHSTTKKSIRHNDIQVGKEIYLIIKKRLCPFRCVFPA